MPSGHNSSFENISETNRRADGLFAEAHFLLDPNTLYGIAHYRTRFQILNLPIHKIPDKMK